MTVPATKDDLALAEPDSLSEVKLDAYYIDDSTEDQRLPHRRTPNEPTSPETLRALGVLSWNIDPDTLEGTARLGAIKRVRGYNYEDLITISPTALPGYEQKIKTFFEEHIHTDEEVRYIVDGSGYFDVRDLEDCWIRIAVHKGDMIVLPEGIYHRFTLDSNDYIKSLRLFIGDPVWTPYNRPQEDHPSRANYLKSFPVKVN